MSDFFEKDWMVYSQPAIGGLARDREFTGETYRVLVTMWGMMDNGNHIKVRTVDIAEHLGIRPSAVGRQIKLLVEKDVLRPRPLYGWRLNPKYGFKGDPDQSLRRGPGGELVLID